jgi:[ribosomal protein S18]-alanine N-acetyltransferase
MIRRATPEDAAAIGMIEKAAFGPDAWSDALIDLELTAPGRVVVVAEEDDPADPGDVPLVVGYASAAVIADVADLTRIAVRPLARRQGVARLLLDALLDRAADEGATRMMLEVDEANEPAVELYTWSGFVEVARRRDYYGSGRDAVVMELAPITGRATLEP